MEKQISLHYQDATSDKIYNVFLRHEGSGFVVNFAYGRRGSSLVTGSKTQAPVDIPAAQKIFDKLVKEKIGKGYKVSGGDDSSQVVTVADAEPSEIHCLLLNEIQEDQIERYLNDDNYLAQEKNDGRRQLVEKINQEIKCINKKGFYVGFSADFNTIKDTSVDFVVDGELMDGFVLAFDILQANGKDLRSYPIEIRLQELHNVVGLIDNQVIREVHTAYSTTEKYELYQQLRLNKKEGIVFKRKGSAYVAGRPASGGDHLKFKFYKTASFIVREQNAKRSVGLDVIWNGQRMDVGNVTIPANHSIPSIGEVVEVRYLYAFKNSGKIFQPVYLGMRSDIDENECLHSQLVFKSEDKDEE